MILYVKRFSLSQNKENSQFKTQNSNVSFHRNVAEETFEV